MGESIGPASSLSCKMPFIVSSNIDKADPATRKLIRRHVMRVKKMKKAGRPGAAGLASTDSNQNHRTQIRIQELLDMYTLLQPGCTGTRRSFVDFPEKIEPSILWNMEQGAWRTGFVRVC